VWKIWLASKLPEADALKASAGWGGDRMVAYSADGEIAPTVINLSVWDTEGDAKEAADAARKLVAKLAGRPEGQGAPAPTYLDTKGEAWSVERRGEKVLIVCGVPAESHTQVVSEVWSGWKVAR
jgi:hypothetical protein